MAGAGYKLFATGDVLTAAQVNTYLQEQAVMVFANAAARTTALSSVLAEGMVTYLKDTDALEIYSGSAWVGYGSGDITGVTAGTGISGGGTSGTVTITNSMATEITAAGDIIVGTGSGTFDNLPIGTTGQILTADTTVSPYKVKWASAAGGGGKVLQVVYGSVTGSTTIATTTFTDTGITATITPSATSSKVLVLAMCAVYSDRQADTTVIDARIMRDSTSVLSTGTDGRFYLSIIGGATRVRWAGYQPLNYLDSPNTTSAVTYKVQGRCSDTSSSGTSTWQLSAAPSNIILLEIGA